MHNLTIDVTIRREHFKLSQYLKVIPPNVTVISEPSGQHAKT